MAFYMTDLAMESGRVGSGGDIPGVNVSRESTGGVERVRVDVLDERGERETGKRPGTYTTLYAGALDEATPETYSALRSALINELRALSGLDDDTNSDGILVLGLGNRAVTPDAIGPRAADMVLATRALAQALPDMRGMRRVMTCAPGVFGATGLEVSEVVQGLVAQLHPALIIAMDALCARDPGRIASTIQISNTGIQPGSGVGNHRAALDRDSLGVRVVALGVPTVVYASTIISDALQSLGMNAADIEHRLDGGMARMIVTPRGIDSLVEHSAHLIAESINLALHPGLDPEQLKWLTT